MATSNNDWDSFNKLVKLDIVSAATKMYANSRNNIELNITVDIVDKNNEKIHVDVAKLRRHLYICDYVTGEKIGSPWNFSDDSNEYTIRFVAGSLLFMSKSTDFTYIKKYIYATLNDPKTLTFSVGIDIPGVGPFDTSLNGTSTLNGPKGESGSVFKSPKSLQIEALRPIDYSLHENLTLDIGAFEEVSSTLEWSTRYSAWGPYKSHNDGTLKRRFVHIRPNTKTTGEEKFEKSEIVYEPLSNKNMNNYQFKWNAWDNNDCFSILNERGGYGQPCAVIGHTWSDGFDVNVWYSGKNNVGIDGPFYAGSTSYYYRFEAKAYKNHYSGYDVSVPTMILYKFCLPSGSTDKYGWNDAFRTASVSVTDLNGNEGKFQLAFDNKDNIEQPGLV